MSWMEFEKSTNFHSCAEDDDEVAYAGYGDRVGLRDYTAVTEIHAASIFRVMESHTGKYSATYMYNKHALARITWMSPGNECRSLNKSAHPSETSVWTPSYTMSEPKISRTTLTCRFWRSEKCSALNLSRIRVITIDGRWNLQQRRTWGVAIKTWGSIKNTHIHIYTHTHTHTHIHTHPLSVRTQN